MTSNDARFGRRVLRHLGSLVARTTTTTVVAVVFLGGMVASLLVPDDRWMTRVQTVASVLSLVLLFALHHTQHRDQIAMQRKLDELLHAHDAADNDVIHLEAASDEALDAIDERQGERVGR
jgi:low affinity Fe/Cu permease